MRILVRFQQNSTAPLQDTKKSVLIDSPLDRQNDRAFDSDDGAARVSSTPSFWKYSVKNKRSQIVDGIKMDFRRPTNFTSISNQFFKINFRPEEKVDCVEWNCSSSVEMFFAAKLLMITRREMNKFKEKEPNGLRNIQDQRLMVMLPKWEPPCFQKSKNSSD